MEVQALFRIVRRVILVFHHCPLFRFASRNSLGKTCPEMIFP
jgi:hypothetical protein